MVYSNQGQSNAGLGSLNDSISYPAQSERERTLYGRSSKATGTDFTFEALGDIKVSSTGDFALISGTDLITQALVRRIYTSVGSYARWVRLAEGVSYLDEDYGSPLPELLSSSSLSSNKELVRRKLRQALEEEKRIVLNDVSVVPTNNQSSTVHFYVSYAILGEEQLYALNYVIDRDGLVNVF